MARKKERVSSKKYINDGANDSGGVSDTVNAGASTAPPPAVASSGTDHENSASKVAAPVNDHNQTRTEKELKDIFYETLVKLHQSSGLSLAFNFRETKVDLYQLYRKVTERGGFHQVSKEGKWNEVVASASILLPDEVQKVYQSLLLQYEQMHHYRSSSTTAKFYDTPRAAAAKQKDNNLDLSPAPTGTGSAEKKSNFEIHFDEKDIKDLQLPLKPRTAYQIFVKKECDRLRKLHGEIVSSRNISYRNMATDAWKHLSQCDRLPFIEASKKDKERFRNDMTMYEQIWNHKIAKKQKLLSNNTSNPPSIINFGPSQMMRKEVEGDDGGGYYVTLEEADADAGGGGGGNFFVLDESLVESNIEILKAKKDSNSFSNVDDHSNPMFQINWDGCCD